MYEIKYNELKNNWCPWELWLNGNLIDAFVSENDAIDRKKLFEEIQGFLRSY